MPKHGPELTIYVSMDGDDINSGSHIRPKRTIAAALSVVRGGNADAILLRRGDTWHEGVVLDRAGTPDLPVLFGAYGDESLPRPILHEIPDDARTRIAILAPYQIIADIDLVGAGGDNALGMSAGVHHVHVEGCRMANWGMGWRINGEVANPCHHVTMRRCVVADNAGLGLWAPYVDDLLIEGCVYDQNGPGDSNRHHNIYMGLGGERQTYSGNILARGSGYGLKTRCATTDMVVEGNLFLANQFGLTVALDHDNLGRGLINANTTIRGNAFLHTGRGKGAWAIEAVHFDGLTITGNYMVQPNVSGYKAAIYLKGPHEGEVVRRQNSVISDNIIAGQWGWGIRCDRGDLSGPNNIISDNVIQVDKTVFDGFGSANYGPYPPGAFEFEANTYDRIGKSLGETWCRLSPDDMTFDVWVARVGDADAIARRVVFANDGLPDFAIDIDAFMADARTMRRGLPMPLATAANAVAAVAAAFTVIRLDPVEDGPVVDPPVDPPTDPPVDPPASDLDTAMMALVRAWHTAEHAND